MREIKLSLKDARKRGEKVGNQPAVITSAKNEFGQPIIEPGRGGEELDLEPTRGWTQAPDLAMLKSRPVDPPRERDIEALRKAALRPPAAWCDWNGPSSDPTIKHAGDEVHRLAIPYTTSDDLPAHAPAPVADSAVGEFEPVGTPWRVGDVVYNERDQYWYTFQGAALDTLRDLSKNEIAAGFKFCTVHGRSFSSQDVGEKSGWRILKRKNVAARAWKNGNGERLVSELNSYYYGFAGRWVPFKRDAGFGDRLPAFGFTEIHDPAEIQCLLGELRDAGLGK